MSHTSLFLLLIVSVVVVLAAGPPIEDSPAVPGPPSQLLPFDRTNPVIYINDDIRDMYTDEYLAALASAGEIDLRASITQSSVPPFNTGVTEGEMDEIYALRLEAYRDALASGLRPLPYPVKSAWAHLAEPESGRIEDTRPLDSDGSRIIRQEAARATEAKPLVVVVGGTLTDVADAYLMDPSIANRIIVSFLGGTFRDMGDYNGWADPWSAYIVLSRLQIVIFPAFEFMPVVSKSEILARLPDTPIRRNMIARHHINGLPGVFDGDSPPAIAVARPDYVTAVQRVTFGGFTTLRDGRKVPAFAADAHGTATLVTLASGGVATAEWFRALTNPAAYKN